MRFQTSPKRFERKVLLFFELGAGYVSVDSDAVSWMIPDLPEDPVGPEETIISSGDDFLLNLGAGISIKAGNRLRIELLPSFHYLLMDEALPYVSVGLGVGLAL